MSAISCTVNFKENLTKNIPYYKLLMKQMNDSQLPDTSRSEWIGEQAALCISRKEGIISKICEGYQFIIAFDGELENTEPLRRELACMGYCFTSGSDAELALNSYIHFGEKSPGKLKGCFSYVIYDAMRRQIFAASDRFSSIPLFWSRTGDSFLLTSRISGILAHPDLSPKITARGIGELLSFSYRTSGNIFEDIFMLPPGHLLKIKDSGILLKKYPLPDSVEENTPVFPSLTENTPVVLSGTGSDELIFGFLSENQPRARIYTYSSTIAPKSAYKCRHTQIAFDENTLLLGLERSVSTCGLPLMSDSDYTLPAMFRKIRCHSNEALTALPIINEGASFRYVLLKNGAIFSPVAETLPEAPDSGMFTFNSPRLIAEEYGINLKNPFLAYPSAFSKELSGNPTRQNPALKTHLKHILLEIIAGDTAPILAFFNKSALLRLCEGGFDFCGSSLTDTTLISYIIKLNIWLSKYRPSII